MNPEFPVYIVSKGRWKTRLTSKALHLMGVPHFIIVESQELALYEAVVDDTATLLVLDSAYQRDYDTCDNLGSSKSKGPGPARNFAWDHSMAQGALFHWVMDDNIDAFHRMNRNIKAEVESGTIFKIMEDFITRYENVPLAGPNYYNFAKKIDKLPPFVLNTRIYSCLLIRNDLPYRWRGRYNEDTDLSLRVLKDGLCTIQFNAFLQGKTTTQRTSGGNSAEFYVEEGTWYKSKMIEDLHPDCANVVWRFNRWHHHVNYKIFKHNKLIRKQGMPIPSGVNDYGMVLTRTNINRPPTCHHP